MRAWLAHCHRQYRMIGYRDRTMLMSLGAVAVNAAIGAGKLAVGVVLLSPWFIVLAAYYLLLCAARGQLLWRFRHTRLIEKPEERFALQLAVFRRSGVFICFLGVSYLFVCLRMYFWGEGTEYPYYLVYGVAGVAFYKVGASIYGMVVSRRIKNPLLTTMKILALMDACVSIVAVQCALLTMEHSPTATQSSAMLGAVCGLVFVGIGIGMLLRNMAYPGPEGYDSDEPLASPKSLQKTHLRRIKAPNITKTQ